MSFQYETIDGQRVEKNVAAAFKLMRADFKKETGLDLLITSGTRTEAEQASGYADYRAGRTKVKWAKPSESSHCEIGPSGPRALDLRDSGRDAGVTVYGSKRWNILKRIGKKYGFTWGGWGVPKSEGWHWENHLVKVGIYGGGNNVPAKAGNPFGIAYCAGLQKIANLYGGGTAIDQIWGAKSAKGFAQFLRKNWGYKGNDVLGPVMWAAIARWLRSRWGYKGNDVPGPVMRAALQRAETANYHAL